MQILIRMDKVVIENYYHMMTITNEIVNRMELTPLLTKNEIKSLYVYIYFEFINILLKCTYLKKISSLVYIMYANALNYTPCLHSC